MDKEFGQFSNKILMKKLFILCSNHMPMRLFLPIKQERLLKLNTILSIIKDVIRHALQMWKFVQPF